MRRLTLSVGLLCLGGCLTGCQTPLDQSQSELIRTWGEGNRAFGVAIETYAKAVDGATGRHYDAQRRLIDAGWNAWLAQQTDEKGQLVYMAADGTIQPMPVSMLVREVAKRDEQFAALAVLQMQTAGQQAAIHQSIADFHDMNLIGLDDNEDIARAKASAQQFIDSALGALGGFAAGAGVGAAVIP